eukprot:UC4_evm2s1496
MENNRLYGKIKTKKEARDANQLIAINFGKFKLNVDAIRESVQKAVHLDSYTGQGLTTKAGENPIPLSELTPRGCIDAAQNPDNMQDIELYMENNMARLAQVLTEAEQTRMESDDMGPSVELDYWRRRMANFNGVRDQLRSKELMNAFYVLKAGRSKLVNKWRDMDGIVTEKANQARDNVKYLYTLDACCEPLYRCNPIDMQPNLGELINSVRMIMEVSHYYNDPRQITALFIKITNQMITACKSYIAEFEPNVWDQDHDSLRSRLTDCQELNKCYKEEFFKVRKRLEQKQSKRKFDFSLQSIFGRFDQFCLRISQIEEMILDMDRFEQLYKSKIEGVDQILVTYRSIVAGVKKRPYDALDHKARAFDSDFAIFKRDVADLQLRLSNLMDETFETPTDLTQSLVKLQRFENLKDLDLDIQSLYKMLFNQFGSELQAIMKQYQQYKNKPPVPRNLPPVSGRIAWARQLARHIEHPMQVFQKRPEIMKGSGARKIIKNYNKIVKVLVEYEILYHTSWCQAIESLQGGLRASLLVENPEKSEGFLVNLDPQLKALLRETRIMKQMKLDVPATCQLLCATESRVNRYFTSLTTLLVEYESTKNKILPQLWNVAPKIARILISRVKICMIKGVTHISWNSVDIDTFILSCQKAVSNLKQLVTRINDLYNIRLSGAWSEISRIQLIVLNPRAVTMEEFRSSAIAQCSNGASALQTQSGLAKLAAVEMLDLIKDQLNPEELKEDRVVEQMNELLRYFEKVNTDVIVRLVRHTLESIRKRIPSRIGFVDDEFKKMPLFCANVVLNIPHVLMEPTLDEIQKSLNETIQHVLRSLQNVDRWTVDEKVLVPDSSANVSNSSTIASYFDVVHNHKDVNRLVYGLTTILASSTGDITHVIDGLIVRFNSLWEDDKDATVEAFLNTGATDLVAFEDEVTKYEVKDNDIMALTDSQAVGPVELRLEQFKLSLSSEAKLWKSRYGKALNIKVKDDMHDTLEFCDDLQKLLSRKVVDLEDVRLAMEGLKRVRENETRIDMLLGPIEQSYALLNSYGISVSKEEVERVDTLRFNWKKLNQTVCEVQDNLNKIQAPFQAELEEAVGVYIKAVSQFQNDWDSEGPLVSGITPAEASDRLGIFQIRFDDLWRKYNTYQGGEELFGLPVTEHPCIPEYKKQLGLLNRLYSLYNQVLSTVNGYNDILWVDIDIIVINEQILEFQTKAKKLPKALKEWDAFLALKKTLDDFLETLPLLEQMKNPHMLARHWKRLSEVCGDYNFDVENEATILRNIIDAPILENFEDVEDICISAIKEADIDEKLKQVINEWSVINLKFRPFKNRGELLLNAGDLVNEVIGQLEDSLMVLGSLMSNRYNAPFKGDIQKWVQKLSTSNEVIEQWLIVQNLYVYLEAVFVGGDIAKQLPKEAKRFSNIDKTWQKIMTRAHEQPNLVQCCASDAFMIDTLPNINDSLEVCQKSLAGYLEKKRLIFPRFFFVSDPGLLEILGQASNSHTIQNHLLNLFDNIKQVTFHEKEYDKIIAYSSKEGETVQMTKPVMATGNVELWLGTLLKEQQAALHDVIRDASVAIFDSSMEITEFMESYPAQVGILGIQILWTADCERALKNSKSDKKIMVSVDQKNLDLLTVLIDQTLKDLSKVNRTRYETLVTLHLHQRDIFHDIVLMKVKSHKDFEWLKQARFYYVEDPLDTMTIDITDWTSLYCMEFVGCVERLCVTPLTDRCYITLAQALLMSMGGAPAGPAGTGKTETVKDMGRALGKYVVVFNCSDQMDYRGLGRIYKGLAQSGSWGCFDEFNRIELPVLSVAAQQIYIVLQAKQKHQARFIFMDGDDVSLDPEFGLFLTMNPGYAGRQELPENLKIQFRTVAMMKPDRQIIIRVKLASCGFQNNIILSRKFYVLYVLCEEQLSKQVHYDFGLRNILSVLRTLGASKRAHPEDSELKIVMRGLRDMNLSKLVDEDEPLMLSLIEDLFPGIDLETAGYEELDIAIRNEVSSSKLIDYPPWHLKCIQLYETQRVRWGFMVLGPSGAGKTTNITTLMKAMTAIPDYPYCGVHKELRMNPKAITAPQMFGRLDVATNDWTDGIFSTLWRRTLKAKKGEKNWIVLDGPIDAVWIENLNSVLDDNRTLTLANGDRIPMHPDCKVVFEPHNVDNASPATVSRNGMVFMSLSVMPWEVILDGWLLSLSPVETETLRGCFHDSFQHLYNYLDHSLSPKMKTFQCNYVSQTITLLNGLLPGEAEASSVTADIIRKLYTFALMWGLGSLLELEEREKLEIQFQAQKNMDLPVPDKSKHETIFEYYVDTVTGNWVHWSNKVSPFDYPTDPDEPEPSFSSILVPNVDNIRTDFLVDTIAKQDKGCLLIGEQGTAKTVIIKGYCRRYNIEEKLFKSFNFSSTSTPNGFQRTIESYIDKRVGTTYGPPNGKKMSIFIDDINMPAINEWRDQVTNEIVRQTIAVKGFYNLEKPGEFTNLADLQFMAAMNHPGGGRNDIPERLKRQFSIFNCTLPSNQSIDTIFSTIAKGHFCVSRRFSMEVCELIEKLVPCTRILWQATKNKMLATPAKFHYVFNLRDLSRIWQGMVVVSTEGASSISSALSLWRHECSRVIADRFVNFDDIKWFQRQLLVTLKEHLGEEIVNHVDDEPWFVDFLREAPEPTGDEAEDEEIDDAPKIYEAIPAWDEFREKLKECMISYNETIRGTKMDLVFFKDAMTHIIKISRIIRTPLGNALLVGVGGSGKQSSTRLASAIAGYSTFQITLSRTYNATSLFEDLKVLYRHAGQEGKGITFLFTDNEVKEETFLEYINNILATGEVSGLFARDEIDEICSELIPVMKAEFPRRPPTPDELYAYFMERVRSNLHVVLCFSPVGEKFRSRTLKFPALLSGCTMDWFMQWPRDALIAVADHFISPFDIRCNSETKNALIRSMGTVQDGVNNTCEMYFERFRRRTYVTPASFLSFLNGYKSLYRDKLEIVGGAADRMNIGLDKLTEAGESVDALSKELAVKEVDLAKAKVETEKVLKEVSISAAAAEKVKAEVQKVKDAAQSLVDSIDKDKSIAESKLAAAKPALDAAEAALNTIKAADIVTVKKLGRPPHLIMRILDCVLILFQSPLDPPKIESAEVTDKYGPCVVPSWFSYGLKQMGPSFLQDLLDFNKDLINEEMCELMEPIVRMKDYNLEGATRVAGAVAGLCAWSEAMYFFFFINKEVLPLKAGLAKAEVKLGKANVKLMEASSILDEKQRELDIVQAKFDETMRHKKELEEDAETCQRKMVSASALIDGLSNEKIRWTAQSKEFKVQIGHLVGDVLRACGFLSYSGPFNAEFRQKLQSSWVALLQENNIPCSDNLDIISMLSSTTQIGEWNIQGLPTDDLSTQNGIITTKATRYPLMIDPQGQAKIWIKQKEASHDLQLTNLNHKYFRTHLEDALGLGRPLLIEDVLEELDPALDNILGKNFIKSGSTFKVKVGDKECDVMKGFMCYITTKLPNPTYTPEVSAQCSIIDFTVTRLGLEDQLLALVITSEKEELETERKALAQEVNFNKKKMEELEANLLHKLVNVQGSLVDDETIIGVLRTTKSTSEDVKEKLAIAAETNIKISAAREEYRAVAARGSILYFLIVEMSLVSPMYQTALKQFLRVFDFSLKNSKPDAIQAKRIANIIEFLTYETFKYTQRGFYEEHKFLYTLLLTLKIDLVERKAITENEFNSFIKGGSNLDLNAVEPKPKPWILDLAWLNIIKISDISIFKELPGQIARNSKAWKEWFDSDAPEEEPIPDGYDKNLNTWKKLLLVRSFCPDRTMAQARKYIAESMGEKYSDAVILDMVNMAAEADVRTPLICFLSMGSDPSNNIIELARRNKLECQAISMGQGQETHARRLVRNYQENGGWALLQNCHLGLDFLTELLDMVLDTECVNDSFKLWITTEVHPKFPINFLQASIKYTFEPPMGVKAGLKRTFASVTQEQLDISNRYEWKPLLYGIAFLHTTVQERRKFGPLGWNIPYEFNEGDLNASMQMAQNHMDDLEAKQVISWKTVRYMLGEVHYGGRVTDDQDKRLLNVFCMAWFGEFMFSKDFEFYDGYSIPLFKSLQEYKDAIEEMSLVDPPDVFGLHANADITYQTAKASTTLAKIVDIQPKESGSGGGETREESVARMCIEFNDKLPKNFNPHEVKDHLHKMDHLAPLHIFLKQEVERIDNIITEVRKTLRDLLLAIKGTIIMSDKLKDALNNIYDARVPAAWSKISWQDTTLGFWFTGLIDRYHQFNRWVYYGRPKSYWMTGFFNPTGFLTAMRQEVTRAHKGWALDNVVLANTILRLSKEEISEAPPEGLYIHGLFIEGASWSRKEAKLVESKPKVLFEQMPIVHVYAINAASGHDPKCYECPVYKKSRRTDLNYIFMVDLKSTCNPDRWTLRGVALLCDPNLCY